MADIVPDPVIANTTVHKLNIAKQKKDSADQAFKLGNAKDALKSYHEALMYLLGLDKNALQSLGMGSKSSTSDPTEGGKEKEKTEVDDILEKIYANMSACHLKNQNWKRAAETAGKALAKNENNYKAMFRKGKALGEQGFFDKALKVLEELKKKNPTDTALVDQEIARLRAIDNEREKAHKNKMKGKDR
ncbi:hypothetical protein HYPSUDRAFT_133165 [Hypholoma sublateritium FD-334 SS-4]|uniref:Uncharacterized protein n=1 Tax=Hypholoma sublateritium (strain FD-334 SS-4) TaxID=945553 RepID=A0A0D2LF89_HYPSF|nr:hypothetical protein HYPSUDRAFT_133165 [Hypholoma sublateritium FD-334 SS-4]